jgi:hypothetical protein
MSVDDEEKRAKKLARRAWYAANKDELNVRLRARYATGPEYRANRLMRTVTSRYGISRDDYAAMLEAQNHACGICRRAFQRTPQVDHCHITGLVRGLLCGPCNNGLGQFGDNIDFMRNAIAYMERWLLHLLQLFNTEENDMTSNDDATEDSKAARLMRKAILHELHQPFGVDPPPPTDWMQAVSRFLVTKAATDINAAKEVLDRIDGKTPSAPTSIETPKQVNISWKLPHSNLNSPHQNSPEPQPKSHPTPTRSSTSRASSSFRSTNGTSGSPAS